MDDTLASVPDIPSAEASLTTLNEAHPSISFSMQTATNYKLPFVEMEIEIQGNQPTTCVDRKQPTKVSYCTVKVMLTISINAHP